MVSDGIPISTVIVLSGIVSTAVTINSSDFITDHNLVVGKISTSTTVWAAALNIIPSTGFTNSFEIESHYSEYAGPAEEPSSTITIQGDEVTDEEEERKASLRSSKSSTILTIRRP